jgi:hypothetical protein
MFDNEEELESGEDAQELADSGMLKQGRKAKVSLFNVLNTSNRTC